MLARCRNKRDPNYGGRGISVDPRWVGDGGFSRFLAEIGPRPSLDHSVDRVDVNGNYVPGNVRWATASEQNSNRRLNRKFTHGGRTLTLGEWATELHMSRGMLSHRLSLGETIGDILSVGRLSPMQRARRKASTSKIEAFGETLTIPEWAARLGADRGTIWLRIKSGWSAERAVSTPVRRKSAERAA